MLHYSLNARMGLEALAAISTIFLLRDLTFDPSSVYFNYIILNVFLIVHHELTIH